MDAARIACASSCYTGAVATLRANITGQFGEGCGFARRFVQRASTACAAAGATCAVQDFVLRSLAYAEVPAPRTARIAASLNVSARAAFCTDTCYTTILSQLVNVSAAANAALPVYYANYYPYENVNDLQNADIAADADLLYYATVANAIVRRTCAVDPTSGNYCAVVLGTDYVWPAINVSAARPLDTAALTRVFSNPTQAVCSPCGLIAANIDATIAGAVAKLLTTIRAIGLDIIGSNAASAVLALRAWSDVAPVAVGVPSAVAALCGVSPSGDTCYAKGSTFQFLSLIVMESCVSYIKNITLDAPATCAPACASALQSLSNSLGCCFAPILHPLVDENAALVNSYIGTSDFDVLSTAAVGCGTPFTHCVVSSHITLSFRLPNLNASRVRRWTSNETAAFAAALIIDVAAALNVDAALVTFVSLSPDASGVELATVTVEAATTAGLNTAATQASSQTSAGLVSFPQAGVAAATSGSTTDGTSALVADPAYPVTNAASTSDALGARDVFALLAAVTVCAFSAALLALQ